MLVVTRAGRLREWSQGELRLYSEAVQLNCAREDGDFKTLSSPVKSYKGPRIVAFLPSFFHRQVFKQTQDISILWSYFETQLRCHGNKFLKESTKN